MGKGKEKKIKQEVVKRAEIEESVEGIEAGPETKKRKTTKSRKQLVIFKETERVDPSTIGKEVGHTLISKIKVKTKVKSSVFQVPVSSSAYGSSGSLDITTQSPLGPSGHTRSRQKTVEESVERERERRARPLSFFCFFFFFLFLFCFVLFCFLFFCHLPVLVFCSVVSPFFLFFFFF